METQQNKAIDETSTPEVYLVSSGRKQNALNHLQITLWTAPVKIVECKEVKANGTVL